MYHDELLRTIAVPLKNSRERKAEGQLRWVATATHRWCSREVRCNIMEGDGGSKEAQKVLLRKLSPARGCAWQEGPTYGFGSLHGLGCPLSHVVVMVGRQCSGEPKKAVPLLQGQENFKSFLKTDATSKKQTNSTVSRLLYSLNTFLRGQQGKNGKPRD